MTKPVYILGINAYDHDVSACLIRDGEIAVGIEKERLTREKHATGFYEEAVDYCLAAERISIEDVSLVVRNCYVLPVGDMEERLVYQDSPSFLDEKERPRAAKHPLFRSTSDKVVTISHHLAHAYSAFAVSPFDEGAVMIVDGVGSYRSDITEPYAPDEALSPVARESESYYQFHGAELTTLKKVWLEPNRGFLSEDFFNMSGLGALYSRASSYVFGDWNKCGELMGLAPYGRAGAMPPFLELTDGRLTVPDWTAKLDQPFLVDSDADWEKSPAQQHWKDLAWRIQDDTERVLIERANWLRETTGAKNLCIAGGVALNCVANGRILRESGFENIWIQPAAGDDGIAIGCAYYGHLAIQKKPRTFKMRHAYLGRSYRDSDVAKSLDGGLVRAQTTRTFTPDICRETAKLLTEGHVFGWFQGRSEFGPRSLGNRAILADPRTPEMKDKLNARVKHRQAFRPFAPIVLLERVADVFEGGQESPYMLLVMQVRPEWKSRIPGIVHVDGTARVQTVSRETNERLYTLLKEFDALTGVPVLLNTSFNVKGEPIVETPEDALRCFLSTGIDYLALHDTLISKTKLHRVMSPAFKAYSEVSTMVRAGLGD